MTWWCAFIFLIELKFIKFLRWLFGKLKTQKSHSEIKWPLYERVFQSVLFGIRYALLSKNDGSRARFRSLWSQSDGFSSFFRIYLTPSRNGCSGFLAKIFQSWNQFWFLIDYLKGSKYLLHLPSPSISAEKEKFVLFTFGTKKVL